MNTSSSNNQNTQRQRLQRPLAVQRAFYILWVYFILGVLTSVDFLVKFSWVGQVPVNTHALNVHQLQFIGAGMFAVIAISFVIFLLLYFIFLFKAYHGRRWARNFLLAFAVFGLLSMVFSFTANPRFLIAAYEHSFLQGIFSSINNLVFLMTVYAVVFLFVNKQAKAFYQ